MKLQIHQVYHVNHCSVRYKVDVNLPINEISYFLNFPHWIGDGLLTNRNIRFWSFYMIIGIQNIDTATIPFGSIA